jgi:hypothetical protein
MTTIPSDLDSLLVLFIAPVFPIFFGTTFFAASLFYMHRFFIGSELGGGCPFKNSIAYGTFSFFFFYSLLFSF